jgi:hypothetical protein
MKLDVRIKGRRSVRSYTDEPVSIISSSVSASIFQFRDFIVHFILMKRSCMVFTEEKLAKPTVPFILK